MSVTHQLSRDVCDFCSEPHPAWIEDANTFNVAPDVPELPRSVSVGGWASCDVCHELILKDRWIALEDRAFEKLRPKYPEQSRRQVRFGVQAIHRQFREHRTSIGWHRPDG